MLLGKAPLFRQLEYILALTLTVEAFGRESDQANAVRTDWDSANWDKLQPQERELCVSVSSMLDEAMGL